MDGEKNNIPQIIHYCWFGRNKKSGLIQQCIKSWGNVLPEYTIKEWNEDSFDVHICPYVEEAYNAQKWAFVSDYARLWALYNYGGVYLDTDVQVLKSFNCFLSNEAFTGYETKDTPVTAVMGAKKGNQTIKLFLDYYKDKNFVLQDGKYNTVTNTVIITEQLKALGMNPNGRKQNINGLTIYPQIFFCPNNFSRIWNKPSPKSYSIHHFDQSWRAKDANHTTIHGRIKRYLVGIIRNSIGSQRFFAINTTIKREKKQSLYSGFTKRN